MGISRTIFWTTACFTTTACVAITPLHDGPTITRADIVESVKCQLKSALYEGPTPHSWLRNWTALVALTLKETNAGGATVGSNLAIPLSPGLTTISLTGKANGEATRTAATEFYVKLPTLDKFNCPEYGDSAAQAKTKSQRNLLFHEEFDRLYLATKKIGELPKSHNYTVNFVIKLTGDIGPSFSMIPLTNNTYGGSLKIDGEKTDTHTLKLTITPQVEKKKPEPIEVVIVGDETVKSDGAGGTKLKFAPPSGARRSRGKSVSSSALRRERARRNASDAQVRDTLRSIQSDLEALRQ